MEWTFCKSYKLFCFQKRDSPAPLNKSSLEIMPNIVQGNLVCLRMHVLLNSLSCLARFSTAMQSQAMSWSHIGTGNGRPTFPNTSLFLLEFRILRREPQNLQRPFWDMCWRCSGSDVFGMCFGDVLLGSKPLTACKLCLHAVRISLLSLINIEGDLLTIG